ncbi:hypothetical protein HK101_009551 [Irineochytrium annulatum]|nr:hypothetical protein HK101_009551 [Irineochytrium annulatum]
MKTPRVWCERRGTAVMLPAVLTGPPSTILAASESGDARGSRLTRTRGAVTHGLRELNLPGARDTLRELDLRIADFMGVTHPDVFRSLPLLVNCSTLRIGCTKFDRAHLTQTLPAMTWLRKLEVRYGGEENFDLPALLSNLVNLEELALIFAHVHGSGAFIEIDELIAPMTRLHSLRLQMGAKESVAYRVSLSPRVTSLPLESGVLVVDGVSLMGQRLDQLESLVVESGYPVEERSGLDYTERLMAILGDKAVAPRLEELRIRCIAAEVSDDEN